MKTSNPRSTTAKTANPTVRHCAKEVFNPNRIPSGRKSVRLGRPFRDGTFHRIGKAALRVFRLVSVCSSPPLAPCVLDALEAIAADDFGRREDSASLAGCSSFAWVTLLSRSRRPRFMLSSCSVDSVAEYSLNLSA
jgi:hypothetical protein